MKNFYYYWFGLFLMVLLKLKSLLFGYQKPRPKNLAENKASIVYVKEVFANFQQHYAEIHGSVPDLKKKRVLEIGPGPDLGTGLLFLMAGAIQYTAIDRFKLLISNVDFYRAFLNTLKPTEKKIIATTVDDIIAQLKKHPQSIEARRLSYLNLPVEKLAQSTWEYDLIFSNAVLEHFVDVEMALINMHDVLAKGGTMYHEIDLQVHTGLVRNADPIGFLRFPAWLYNLLKPIGHPNRLRAHEYVALAKQAGFKKVKLLTVNALSGAEVEQCCSALAKPYRDMSINELRPLSIILTAQK